jgi:peptidoglycan-associated lipoprotein
MNPASNISTASPSIAPQTAAPLVTKGSEPGEPRRDYQLAASGLVLLALLIGGAWMFWMTQDGLNPIPSSSTVDKPTAAPSVEPLKQPVVVAPQTESIHTDVYFDSARSRLRTDAKTILQAQVPRLKDGTWTVLVQGYTDPQGPATYNKALGLRRAEAVKDYLVELGVPASAITAVSLGKEAVICTVDTNECQQRNRRVHLELVPIPPAVSSETATQVTQPMQDASEASVRTPEQPITQETPSSPTP